MVQINGVAPTASMQNAVSEEGALGSQPLLDLPIRMDTALGPALAALLALINTCGTGLHQLGFGAPGTILGPFI